MSSLAGRVSNIEGMIHTLLRAQQECTTEMKILHDIMRKSSKQAAGKLAAYDSPAAASRRIGSRAVARTVSVDRGGECV